MVYVRKYHLENKINDMCKKYNLYLPFNDRDKIHQIFKEIGKILPQVNGDRKRMITINYVLKKLFQMSGVQCDKIVITKSRKTPSIFENIGNKSRI